jgi:hypothetical protein
MNEFPNDPAILAEECGASRGMITDSSIKIH